MISGWRLGAALSMLVLTTSLIAVEAQARNDIPSCYGTLGADAPPLSPPERSLFVIIDETVHADKPLKQALARKALGFIGPGDELHVLKFGAYIDNHYTTQPFEGRIDPAVTESQRYAISKRSLNKFDTCLYRQAGFVKKRLAAAITDSFGDGATDIPKTELIGNLSILGSLVARSDANEKVVLLFSDMLENSDITSFYHRGQVKKITPEEEFEKLKASGIESDWGGAKVYVMGAGLVADNAKAYRSQTTMDALEGFWHNYFTHNNASLEGWGTPMLLIDLP